jgi:hypothetical protein
MYPENHNPPDGNYLLRGAALQRVHTWAETKPLPDITRAFLQASAKHTSISTARRLGALLADIVLASLITVTAFSVLLGSVPSIQWFLPATAGFFVICRAIGYRFGCTPGMWLSRLALASADGSPITWRQAVLLAVLVGFPKDATRRTTVISTLPRTEKPLALRAIVFLAWMQIVISALFTAAIMHGVGPPPPVAEHDVLSGFFRGVASGALQNIGYSPGDYYDYRAAGAASAPLLTSGFLSVLILGMVRLRAATAITILSVMSIWGGFLPIAMLVLSLRRSVRTYCRGVTAPMRTYLRYRRQMMGRGEDRTAL